MAGPRLWNAPLRQAVCELRFPPKPAFADSTLEALGNALDERYDAYQSEEGVNLQIGPGGVKEVKTVRHRFDSENGWAVAIASETLTLEATAYEGITDFIDRWRWVWEAVHDILRPRRTTRLGLRYINILSFPEPIEGFTELSKWIDPRLLEPWQVLQGDNVRPVSSLHEMRIESAGSFLTMRHGLADPSNYVLDFDHYIEPNESQDLAASVDLLTSFNERIAAAFQGSVTEEQWKLFEPAES